MIKKALSTLLVVVAIDFVVVAVQYSTGVPGVLREHSSVWAVRIYDLAQIILGVATFVAIEKIFEKK